MRTIFSVIVAVAWLFPSLALAHENTPSIATITVSESAELQISIKTSLEALILASTGSSADLISNEHGLEYASLRDKSVDYLTDEFNAVLPFFLKNIHLKNNGSELALDLYDLRISNVGDTNTLRETTINFRTVLNDKSGDIQWLWSESFGAVIVRIDDAEGNALHSEYLQAGKASARVNLRTKDNLSLLATLKNYVVIGYVHIIPKGLDHILFILSLFLLSTQIKTLFTQITVFTLAHSFTLALSILANVSIPSIIVEPLIALSIIVVAVENLMTKRLKRKRLAIIFLFGLLHGLGFATVLADIGLSMNHFVAALLAFNIGVEAGQLTVVTIAFICISLFVNKPWYRRFISQPLSALIGLVGVIWFLQRLILI